MNAFNHNFIISFLALGLVLGGCATDSKTHKKTNTAKEKQRKYDELAQSLSDGSIRKGTPAAEIKADYGEPSDIFSSGTTTGSTDIWTYNKLPDPGNPTEMKIIRLYFGNSRLIDWTY